MAGGGGGGGGGVPAGARQGGQGSGQQPLEARVEHPPLLLLVEVPQRLWEAGGRPEGARPVNRGCRGAAGRAKASLSLFFFFG